MLGILENVAISTALQWLFSGVFTLGRGALTFTWAHPFLAGFVWFSLFIMTFLAYGTLRRMWEDGTFATLHVSHKALLLAFLILPFCFAYLFDIFVMRCGYGWIRFGVAPPNPFKELRKFLGAEGTFSHLIWELKDSDAEAQWWHQILHAIDPKGH